MIKPENYPLIGLGILNPVIEWNRVHPGEERKLNFILQGLTNNLSPVCFLTGGPMPGTGTFPSLELFIHLEPRKFHIHAAGQMHL